jgi:hypothetical protein
MHKRTFFVLPLLLLVANYAVAKDETPTTAQPGTGAALAAADIKANAADAETLMPPLNTELLRTAFIKDPQALTKYLEIMGNRELLAAGISAFKECAIEVSGYGEEAEVVTSGLVYTVRNLLEVRKRKGDPIAISFLSEINAFMPFSKKLVTAFEKMLTEHSDVDNFSYNILLPSGDTHQLVMPYVAWKAFFMGTKGVVTGLNQAIALPDCVKQSMQPNQELPNAVIPVPRELSRLLDMSFARTKTAYDFLKDFQRQQQASAGATQTQSATQDK